MKGPNRSHIFRTLSISAAFLGVFRRCQITCSPTGHEYHIWSREERLRASEGGIEESEMVGKWQVSVITSWKHNKALFVIKYTPLFLPTTTDLLFSSINKTSNCPKSHHISCLMSSFGLKKEKKNPSQSFHLESQGSHTHNSIYTHHMSINPHAPSAYLSVPHLPATQARPHFTITSLIRNTMHFSEIRDLISLAESLCVLI